MSNHNEHDHDSDVTQGENPGAQGDFGAGQGDPGDESTGDVSQPLIEGDDQPRRDEVIGEGVDSDFGGTEQRGTEQI